MRIEKLCLSAALAVSVCVGCESSEPEGTSETELVGEWSASLPRDGEFSSVEWKLYLVKDGDAYSGQLQTYHGSDLDEQVRLQDVSVDAAGKVELRFEGEDEAHVTLTLSEDQKSLSGTVLYDEGSAGKESVTLTRTGDVKPCAGACLGGFCDLGAGQCITCGDGLECDEECTADDQCPYDAQACAPEGLCKDACENDDQCAPWLSCSEGFCVRD